MIGSLAVVLAAVQQVLEGETILNPEIATQVLRRLSRETPSPHGRVAEERTRRESEVLRLLAHGLGPRTIMDILGHSQIAMTANTYTSVAGPLRKEAMERINRPSRAPIRHFSDRVVVTVAVKREKRLAQN